MLTAPQPPLLGSDVEKSCAAPRVAIVCDFLDEKWQSMNLVGDMLYEQLRAGHHRELSVSRIRPQMERRFQSLPLLGENKFCFRADCATGRFYDYPKQLRGEKEKFELFHIIDHTYSQLALEIAPARTIITCHDLDAFRCLLYPHEERRPRWFRAMTRRILDGFLKANHVICCTSAIRDELLALGFFPEHRVSVIPNGVHPSCSAVSSAKADQEAADLLGSAPGQSIELLHVGTTAPRKRIDVLLRVLAEIRKRIDGVRLIRVGGPLTDAQRALANDLGLSDCIAEMPVLERDVLAAVYRRSALLLQTSEREGFGLPVVEALASGCPVVASDLPVLREVGGPEVSYGGIGDIAGWAKASIDMLQERSEHPRDWDGRRQRGIAWAGRYSWAENARQTARIYRQVIEEQPSDERRS